MHLCKDYRLGSGIRADAPVVISLKKDQSACVCTDSLGGSIYIERCMSQDNPVVLSAIVELMDAVESAGQKGGAQYTAYLKTTGKKRLD